MTTNIDVELKPVPDQLVNEITDNAMDEIEGILTQLHLETSCTECDMGIDDVRHVVEFYVEMALQAGNLAGQATALIRQRRPVEEG